MPEARVSTFVDRSYHPVCLLIALCPPQLLSSSNEELTLAFRVRCRVAILVLPVAFEFSPMFRTQC